jgi:SAM-dependent methyltransferase
MSMDQCNPNFNDAMEKYFPGLTSPLARACGYAITLLERFRVWALRGKTLTNERIVEYPLVFRLLRPSGRVLDVGCVSSRLPLQLASLGYEVHGIDLRSYPLSHPAFTFHRLDLLRSAPPFSPASFDIITAISSIEHFGLGGYGDRNDSGGDQRAMDALRNLLKPGGQLVITCPFGQRGVTRKHRVYDEPALRRLLSGFEIARGFFFARRDGHWTPAPRDEVAQLLSPKLPVQGVAILDCVRS